MKGLRADAFLEVMYRIEYFTLNRAWAELTDDELFWEPVPDCWSVRPRAECRTSHPFGAGDWVADFAIPEPEPAPITTIAWLLWHVGSMPGRLTEIDFMGGTREMSSGWTSPYLTHFPVSTSAAAAVSTMRAGWEALRTAIEQMDDAAFEVTVPRYTYASGPPEGGVCALGEPGPEHPVTFFVAGVLNEVSHHATQVCTLRDLYAVRG